MSKKGKPSPTKERYHLYLQSSAWAAFKAAKEEESPKVCRACSSCRVVQLHHMIYRATPEQSRLSDTVWLCQSCHQLYHSRKSKAMKGNTRPDVMVQRTLDVINGAKQKAAGKVVRMRNPQNPPRQKRKAALSSFTGIVVVSPALCEKLGLAA